MQPAGSSPIRGWTLLRVLVLAAVLGALVVGALFAQAHRDPRPASPSRVDYHSEYVPLCGLRGTPSCDRLKR